MQIILLLYLIKLYKFVNHLLNSQALFFSIWGNISEAL